VTWVDARGDVHVSSKGSEEAIALCGGLGLFGTITELTLQLTEHTNTHFFTWYLKDDTNIAEDVEKMLAVRQQGQPRQGVGGWQLLGLRGCLGCRGGLLGFSCQCECPACYAANTLAVAGAVSGQQDVTFAVRKQLPCMLLPPDKNWTVWLCWIAGDRAHAVTQEASHTLTQHTTTLSPRPCAADHTPLGRHVAPRYRQVHRPSAGASSSGRTCDQGCIV